MKTRIHDDATNKYRTPLSSSPEYNNNSVNAWFNSYTNYDLSLIKNFYLQYLEVLSTIIGETQRYIFLDSQLYPSLDANNRGLSIAPNQDLDESHRHHAHLMAIHPLGLLNVEDSVEKDIIKKSLRHLEKIGTREWCGYSFSWAACIYARAQEADNAVKNLQIFATNFCSPNSFHLNGDQKGGQYSNFTYRPFTLEGNFAFAQGVHELLIQSHKGYIEIFPAVPSTWKDVSFKTLRTEGAFLVSASKENGVIDQIKITAEAGGLLSLKLPLKTWLVTGIERSEVKVNDEGIAEVNMKKGQTIIFKNGYE